MNRSQTPSSHRVARSWAASTTRLAGPFPARSASEDCDALVSTAWVSPTGRNPADVQEIIRRYAGKKDYGRESTDDPNLLTFRVGEEGYRLVCTCFYGGEVVGFVVTGPFDIDWDQVELHKLMREDFPGVKLPPLKEHEDLSPLAEELDRRGAVEGIPEALADYRGILMASGKKRLDIYQVESSFLDKKWRGTRAGQHMYLHLIHRLAEMSAVLVPGSWPSDKADHGTSTSARRVWKSLGSYATVVGLIAWGGGARVFPPLVSRPRGFDTPEKARRRKLTASKSAIAEMYEALMGRVRRA